MCFLISNIANAKERSETEKACSTYYEQMKINIAKKRRHSVTISKLEKEIENLRVENKFYKGLSEKMWRQELN